MASKKKPEEAALKPSQKRVTVCMEAMMPVHLQLTVVVDEDDEDPMETQIERITLDHIQDISVRKFTENADDGIFDDLTKRALEKAKEGG